MPEDLSLPGPLERIAEHASAQSGVNAEDAFAAALCWWSAAIAPAVSLPFGLMCWPPVVWGAFLAHAGQSSLLAALEGAGLQPRGFHRLGVHVDVKTASQFRRAAFATRRRVKPGTLCSLLLTGSPFGAGASRESDLRYLLRSAWDGKEYRRLEEPTAWSAPRTGILWETSNQKRWHHTWSEPATSSRLLIFRRHAHASTPQVHARSTAAHARCALEHISHIYNKLDQRDLHVSMTEEAAEKLWLVRECESLVDEHLPHPWQNQFVRLDAHTHRIAAGLAVADETDTISGEHIATAWSVVHRACRDRVLLLQLPRRYGLAEVLGGVEEQMRAATGLPPATGRPLNWDAVPSKTETATAGANAAARDTAVTADVKSWHVNQCQMCRVILRIPGPQKRISHGAHIRPLSEGGADYTGNMLCLCPNCHILLDSGGRYLTDSLQVVDAVAGEIIGDLATDPRHTIDVTHVRWHRGHWTR